MIKYSKKAFSFVELIITLAIIVLLATVWLVWNKNYKDKVDNTKSVSDIETIKNALVSYSQEKKELPLPKWNNNFFKEDSSYAHSYTWSDTYWVHGFITEDTLPKKYLNVLPLDPKTSQYYAYWKTKATDKYELSWINWKNWEAEAFVKWNYTAEVWPYNLIREYNWPNFVYNKSKSNFPYNPDEKILVGNIIDFTWSVSINDTITDTNQILNHVLVAWDKINVIAWWFAEIYFSDGSNSTLWDANWDSELILERMTFKENNNLFTNIRLALTSWTIWNKATNLDDNSDFEIYTTDATAAVRWTIFWVRKDSTSNLTNITVTEWKVNVSPTPEQNTNTHAVETEIVVLNWETEKWVDIYWETNNNQYSTGAIDSIPAEIKENIIDNIWNVTNTIQPEIKSYNRNNTNFSIKIKLSKAFKKAKFLKIVLENNDSYKLKNNWKNNNDNLVIIDWNTIFKKLSRDASSADLKPFSEIIWENKSMTIYFWKNTKKWEKLSKWKILNLLKGEYSLRNNKIIEDEHCSTFYVWTIGNKECVIADNSLTNEGYNLIAYAPYNTSWDINLYKKVGNTYIVNSNSIKGNTASLPEICNSSSASSSVSSSISRAISNTTISNIWDSFCDTWSEKWIYLDSNWNDDLLKYSWLNLNNTDNFAIEMRVRFPTSIPPTSYLFQLGNYKLYIYNWNLILKKGTNQDSINIVHNWEFKKIIAKKEWSNYQLIVWSNTINFNSSNNIDNADLYILSDKEKHNQFNNVIDYIKIYTKN